MTSPRPKEPSPLGANFGIILLLVLGALLVPLVVRMSVSVLGWYVGLIAVAVIYLVLDGRQRRRKGRRT